MLHNRRNSEILLELDSHVSGHIEAKKALINLINRSKIRHFQKWQEGIDKEYLIQPHKLLLIGQSGTGKTHLIESLKEVVEFPLLRIDATKLNPTGASGGIKEDELRQMIVKKAREWCEIRERVGFTHSVEGVIDQMVVFIDEIDKLGRPSDSTGNWNNHVQANFLTLFDNKAEFAGVSFIFAGAFSEITGGEEISRASIGFTKVDSVEKSGIDERIIEAGLLPELVGRLTTIVELDKFTEREYYNILVDRLIPKKLITMAFFNTFESDLSEDELRQISKKAFNSGQGIRALQRELDKIYSDVEFDNEYKLHKQLTYGEGL